jgi:hypothetical protein
MVVSRNRPVLDACTGEPIWNDSEIAVVPFEILLPVNDVLEFPLSGGFFGEATRESEAWRISGRRMLIKSAIG